MQHINQLIYAIFFAFTLKLSYGSFLDFKYKKNYSSSHVYWTIASGALAISCLSWAIAPALGFGLLTIAATGLILSMLALGLLFRSLTKAISKRSIILAIGFLTVFAAQFEIYRVTANFANRSILTVVTLSLVAVWQLIELKKCIKKEVSIHLKMALFFVLLMISIIFIRLYAIKYQNISITQNVYDENFTMFALRACFIASQVLILISLNNYFYERLWKIANEKVSLKEDQMLSSLKSLSLARDNETGNHIIRTQHYVRALATRLKSLGYYAQELTDESIESMVKAAPLHDIGKVGVADSILMKPGRLTPSEWEIMKTHTSIGEWVLRAAETALNKQDDEDVVTKAMRIAGGHHEKWDGSGYPRGLKGDKIPLEARIMSLADIYDALVSERVYKKEWSYEQAVKEILSKRGTQFDPVIVDAFLLEAEHFREIALKLKDY